MAIPSNILDDGYPLGGINMNGDTPVILAYDGPTSGGFVVAGTVAHGALWKLGQVRPGTDMVRFRPVTLDEALALERTLASATRPRAQSRPRGHPTQRLRDALRRARATDAKAL